MQGAPPHLHNNNTKLAWKGPRDEVGSGGQGVGLQDPRGRLQQDQEFSITGFLGWDFAKSQDPGIFQDRISLKFYAGILPKKVRNL